MSRPGKGADGQVKVIGAGLNKTGTKTLRQHLVNWGYRHRTYDSDAFLRYRRGDIAGLLGEMEMYDSFEDWPWPLIYREADERFPGSKFVLTIRKSPEVWFRSLCKMAVRMGPLDDYERHVYGYSMPQGHKQEHIDYYERHNSEVIDYFSERPEQLLVLCWETGQGVSSLRDFLGVSAPMADIHTNQSMNVYGGDRVALAKANRVAFQSYWKARGTLSRFIRKVGLIRQ